MLNERLVLIKAGVGNLVGEEEVYNVKRGGKRALYSVPGAQNENLGMYGGTSCVAADPGGITAFRGLMTGPLSDDQFRDLWKLHFLSTAANHFRLYMESSRQLDSRAVRVINTLTSNGLLGRKLTAATRLEATLEFVANALPSFDLECILSNRGMNHCGKLRIKEPSTPQRGARYHTVDNLLRILDDAYRRANVTAWLVVDRLSIQSAHPEELERSRRALFRSWLDMLSLNNIKVRILLKDHLWKKTIARGSKDGSQVTRSPHTSSSEAQQSALVAECASAKSICDYYGLKIADILLNPKLYKIFLKTMHFRNRLR